MTVKCNNILCFIIIVNNKNMFLDIIFIRLPIQNYIESMAVIILAVFLNNSYSITNIV